MRTLSIMLAAWLVASAAAAQATASSSTPSGAEILPRGAFHMTAEHIYQSADSARFVWDANFGGELDLVDYGRGRTTFYANYQAILGRQLHEFDPNQGNYILTGSTSWRAGAVEVAGVFHHESRHLSDREKRVPVDWNMIGGRADWRRRGARDATTARVDLRWAIKRSYIDYDWELDSHLRQQVDVAPRAAVYGEGGVRVLGVNGTRDRGTQSGYRAEGGVRIHGRGGAVELFIAGERRIDPYPLEFGTDTWVTAGFKLLSR